VQRRRHSRHGPDQTHEGSTLVSARKRQEKSSDLAQPVQDRAPLGTGRGFGHRRYQYDVPPARRVADDERLVGRARGWPCDELSRRHEARVEARVLREQRGEQASLRLGAAQARHPDASQRARVEGQEQGGLPECFAQGSGYVSQSLRQQQSTLAATHGRARGSCLRARIASK
jgi:hypothetical protein